MSETGYLGWAQPFGTLIDGRFFLGGRYYDFWPETDNPLTVADSDGCVVLTTHGGRNIVQLPYRSAEAPLYPDRKSFSTGFIADSEADYRAIERQESLGAPVLFFPGMPVSETFKGGNSYRLLRPPAYTVVAGVTVDDFPNELHLDEALAPDAATISGQTVSAASPGVLAVTYYPAFWVIVTQVQRVLSDVQQLVVSFTLTEIVA